MKLSARNIFKGRIVSITKGMRASILAGASLFLLASAAPALAQTDACAGFKWPIAREQQAFGVAMPTVADGAAYSPGLAVTVKLSAQPQVAYTVKPKRAPKSSPAYGAELTGLVTQAGTYQATLSDEAWIDLAQGGHTLRPSGFSDKTGCPGVRKSLRFQLQAGPVTLAISDSAANAIKLDLLPVE